MKNGLLHRRLAALEAKAKIGAEAIERNRIADDLRKLTDDELEQRYQQTVTDSKVSSQDLSKLSVHELVARYRSEIAADWARVTARRKLATR